VRGQFRIDLPGRWSWKPTVRSAGLGCQRLGQGNKFTLSRDDGVHNWEQRTGGSHTAMDQPSKHTGQPFPGEVELFSLTGKPFCSEAERFSLAHLPFGIEAESFSLTRKPVISEAERFSLTGKPSGNAAERFSLAEEWLGVTLERLGIEAERFSLSLQSEFGHHFRRFRAGKRQIGAVLPLEELNMAKRDFLEQVDIAFVTQLLVFKNAIGPYETLFGLTPAEVAQQAADADFFKYVVEYHAGLVPFAKAVTAYRNNLRSGKQPGPAAVVPVPVLPPPPPAVPPGVEVRFRRLVGKIKRHPKYELSIGKLLGIEGVAPTKKDVNELLPTFTLELRATGVFIRWGWDNHHEQVDMVEFMVNRHDGKGERLVTIDATPGFLDKEPFPAAPVKWTYRAIFHKGEFRVSQWSVPVSIVVGG